MKIHANFTFIEYDKSATPKGEAFDEELRSQLEAIEIDGYECEFEFTRSKSELESDESALDKISDSTALAFAKELVIIIDKGRGEEPSSLNKEFTNSQMLAWQVTCLAQMIEGACAKKKKKQETLQALKARRSTKQTEGDR